MNILILVRLKEWNPWNNKTMRERREEAKIKLREEDWSQVEREEWR